MILECHYKELIMQSNVSQTCSSQNSVLTRADVSVEEFSASSTYLTEKLRQDIDTSCSMQDEIRGSKDNFSAAIQAIHDLTETFAAISENIKLLGEIAIEAKSLTMSTAAEPVKSENM